MNIKKLFAVLAGVSMLAVQLIPTGALAATYSQELQDAYNWAYSKGVTTMSPIDNANMYGAITRSEMAKMLSVYATEVLGMAPDASAACTFSDIASVKGDLHDYIIESCQLGIMGQGISAFRPYDTISRAEFGTALSRVLWGSQYEGGTPYYAKHLDALKAAGIMTQISNAESTKEIRGYVMLMLMRSEGNDAVVDCDDPMTVIACTTNTDACPAACKNAAEPDEDVVVKSGDLAVTATPAAGRKAILNVASDLDTLKFKTSEEVTITKVVLERYGYSKAKDVHLVWLEDENGNIISSQAKVGTRDQVTLSIKKEYRTVDGSFNATIVAQLTGDVTTGGTIGFKIVDAESTAKNLNLDDYTPYEYDMVGYEAASDVTVDARWSDKTYNYEEGTAYEVAKLKVKAAATAITVNGFTLTNSGAARTALDLNDFLDKVEVTLDGDAVKGVEYNVNKKDGTLNISFNGVEIAAKTSAVFAVSISLADFDAYGSTVKLVLAQTTDFKAVEKKTGARITLLPGNMPTAYPTYTFAGSKIKLANTKLWNIEYAEGSSDVVVSEWKITLSEAVENVGPFVVRATYTTSGGANFTGNVIEEMRLLIAGEEYTATKSQSSNVATFTFPSNMDIEKSGKYQVVVDLNMDEDALPGTVVEFDGTFDDAVFANAKYTDADKTSYVQSDEISGVISFAKKLTLQAGKSSFTNSLTKGVEFLDNDVTTKTVFDGTYTAKKNDVNLTEFLVNGSVATGVSATFYLYIDGKEVADARIKLPNTSAKDSISKVSVAAGDSVKVRVDAEVSAKNALTGAFSGGDLGKFGIVLKWEDDNNNPINTKEVKTVSMKVVGSESLKVADASNARAKDVALKGSEATLAQFTVKPSKSDSADFESVQFTAKYGGTNYDADDLVVTLGNTELDCSGNGTITCEAEPVEKVWTAGATITIKVSDTSTASWDVEVKVSKLNTEAITEKVFEKHFLDAVVRVEKQEWKKNTTIFTLSLDVADDYEDDDPVGIAFYLLSGDSCGTTPIYANTWADLDASVTVTNAETAAMVCGVSYGYNGSTYDYNIKKSVVEGYFKDIPTVEGSTSSKDELMINAKA